jgi:hypothetical protein
MAFQGPEERPDRLVEVYMLVDSVFAKIYQFIGRNPPLAHGVTIRSARSGATKRKWVSFQV